MYTPNDDVLKEVRAELVARGTSFNAFCKENGFVRQAVAYALSGQRSGVRALKLRNEFLTVLRWEK